MAVSRRSRIYGQGDMGSCDVIFSLNGYIVKLRKFRGEISCSHVNLCHYRNNIGKAVRSIVNSVLTVSVLWQDSD